MVDHLEDTRIEDIAQAEAAGAPVPHRLTVHDVVATLAHRLATQDAPVMEGVTLASLHSAKGLEWDAVFLCGLNEGLMPITFAQTSDEIDEERRLFLCGDYTCPQIPVVHMVGFTDRRWAGKTPPFPLPG